MKEEWRDIQGFEGFYQASSLGRIRSLDKTIVAKNGVEMSFAGKVLSNKSFDYDGYELYGLVKDRKSNTKKGHRLVAETFLPNPDNLPQVNHKNGKRNDNRVSNLEWITGSDNQKHAFRELGRKKKVGEELSWSVLTEDLVIELRELKRTTKITYSELEAIYGISRSTIHLAVTKKTWSHIE